MLKLAKVYSNISEATLTLAIIAHDKQVQTLVQIRIWQF